MKLAVTTEHRFERTPDGKIWTGTVYDYLYWKNYLEVFDQVHVVARVRDMEAILSASVRADGPGVSFYPLPYFVGPWQYLLKMQTIRNAARDMETDSKAVILINGNVAGVVENVLNETGHPYGMEVIGDPYDVFSPGSTKNPLRSLFRWWSARALKRQCAGACAVAYVTEFALQKRYPPAPGFFSTYFSNIVLADDDLIQSPMQKPLGAGVTLITVGTMDLLYKAQDVLINAVNGCVKQGLDIRLVLVGDGRYRKELETQAASLGLADRIRFLGKLTGGEAVRRELDRAHIFILPSRQEGLPRAMVEAMARALPCIGSSVGGIPELLPPEDLVPPGDVEALANKIFEVATAPQRLETMSVRNLKTARHYSNEILQKRRVVFYQHVKEKTDEWLKSKLR